MAVQGYGGGLAERLLLLGELFEFVKDEGVFSGQIFNFFDQLVTTLRHLLLFLGCRCCPQVCLCCRIHRQRMLLKQLTWVAVVKMAVLASVPSGVQSGLLP